MISELGGRFGIAASTVRIRACGAPTTSARPLRAATGESGRAAGRRDGGAGRSGVCRAEPWWRTRAPDPRQLLWSPRRLSIRRRNGPCSGGRFADTGPASRTVPPGRRRSVIVMTASGVPSGSASRIRPASGLMALAGPRRSPGPARRSRPAARPSAVTESTSAGDMNPRSGARAPDSSSSRSPSWPSSRVHAGRPVMSADSPADASAVTFTSVRRRARSRAVDSRPRESARHPEATRAAGPRARHVSPSAPVRGRPARAQPLSSGDPAQRVQLRGGPSSEDTGEAVLRLAHDVQEFLVRGDRRPPGRRGDQSLGGQVAAGCRRGRRPDRPEAGARR